MHCFVFVGARSCVTACRYRSKIVAADVRGLWFQSCMSLRWSTGYRRGQKPIWKNKDFSGRGVALSILKINLPLWEQLRSSTEGLFVLNWVTLLQPLHRPTSELLFLSVSRAFYHPLPPAAIIGTHKEKPETSLRQTWPFWETSTCC